MEAFGAHGKVAYLSLPFCALMRASARGAAGLETARRRGLPTQVGRQLGVRRRRRPQEVDGAVGFPPVGRRVNMVLGVSNRRHHRAGLLVSTTSAFSTPTGS